MKLCACAPPREPRNAPPSEPMAERIPEALQERLAKRLTFYQDIGIQLFYRDRYPQQLASIAEEITLPKTVQKTQPVKPVVETRPARPKPDALPLDPGPSPFT